MANGFPAGWVYPQQPPAAYPDAAPVPVSPGDDSDLWWALVGVTGGAAVLGGLLCWVAVSNAKDHAELWQAVLANDQQADDAQIALQQEIAGVGAALNGYRQEHAQEHALLAREQDAVHSALQSRIDDLRYQLAPALASAPAPLQSSIGYALPSARPVSYVPSAPLLSHYSTVPTLRSPTLPAYMEAAMSQAAVSTAPAYVENRLRASRAPTLRIAS